MKLFITDVNLFEESFFKNAQYIPPAKKTDLETYKNPLSKKEHILAWSLLSYVYETETGGKREDIQLLLVKNGKPYLKADPFFFNLSYSCGKVICAVGKKEVGADVQFIKEAKPAVIKRVLCENEQKVLACCADSKETAFMRFWTQKESYLKYTGDGISAGLSGLDFSSAAGKERFRLFSKEFLTFSKDGFVYSVCFDEENAQIIRLTPDDLSSALCR